MKLWLNSEKYEQYPKKLWPANLAILRTPSAISIAPIGKTIILNSGFCPTGRIGVLELYSILTRVSMIFFLWKEYENTVWQLQVQLGKKILIFQKLQEQLEKNN